VNWNKKIISTFLVVLIAGSSLAQKTTIYTQPNVTYNDALELYDKEKFSAAQEKFAAVLKNNSYKKSEVVVNSKYYHAICGLELFNNDSENLLVEFINAYPESPKVKLAYFHLGRYQFRKKKYEKAIVWFNKIEVYDLSDKELAEYYFKKGYAYFMEEDFDNAAKSFYEIKDVDTKYTETARYYYAHISYQEKKYESALKTFQSLEKSTKFGPIVPYYIIQIYYLQKKYNDIIVYAPPLLSNAMPKRASEIARILGEAFYHKKQYENAIPYLKRYQKEKPYEATREEKYQLGFAYFKSDSSQLAIDWLKKSITKSDSLSQIAHYHMAECYLKLDNKKYAGTSFRQASQMDFDPEIKEDALLSYAKIAYELSYHPYNDAIIAFEEFINTYPNSEKLKNAYTFLVTVYFTTKNYKAALISLENINKLDPQLQEAYQKIALYRGIELFNNGKYAEAITNFNKSDNYQINKDVKADNMYWRAEAYYRLKQYEIAIGEYKKYIFEPSALYSNKLNKAHYNIGYGYFKLKEYSNANPWFRKYVQNAKDEETKIKNDALNRIGDCFFINKEYKAAIEYYDKAAMLGVDKADYSLYQSAVANGVIENYTDKTNLLKTLINRKQKSRLLDDAIYQLGKTQLILHLETEASANFNLIVKEHPNSPYYSKSLVKIGLIDFNKGDDEKALTTFKEVVIKYPNTPEATQSLKQIKKIYIDKGQLAPYEAYISTIGGADSSAKVMDADYYEVAENSYMAGDCNKATNDLTKYIEKYPKGIYLLNAYYYKADCENKANFINEALIDFNYVIKQPKNKFTENALLKAAIINTTLGRLKEAIENYSKLEYLADIQENVFKAQVAQMKINFELKNYDAAIKYAELIINKDIENPLLITQSHLILAKSAMEQDDYNLAMREFTTASSSSNKFGAQAKFYVSYILHLRGEHDKCETEVFSLIKKFPSYGYWIGRGLILLGDNYVGKEDLFQAKITFQNVIDNSSYPELVSTAKEKRDIIIKQEENEKRKIVENEDEVDVDFMEDSNLERLFESEEEIIEEELPKEEQKEEVKDDK
jgi:TolA-binding protein